MKRKTDNFNKFYNKKRNSAIKEEFRQEKKAAKKERKEAIERRFEEKRQARSQQFPADRKLPGKTKPATVILKRGTTQSTDAKLVNPDLPTNQAFKGGAPKKSLTGPSAGPGETLPLNKYIAHGGICSRRDAADLIRLGKVTVNGQTITEPGTKVLPTDTVKANGKKVTISRNFVYILLNKPKDYITTTDDPQGRKTVLDLIRNATQERVFPVGRLDRNTSGVLLLTNDGDLSQKLAHPSHEIKKIYHVTLDKALTKADFDKIINGEVVLEDGPAHVDVLAYADPKDKMQIGLEIHSGRNRIVRRIFEQLGYDVRGLDRVMYAGLTKKNVQRGTWRLLSEKEIRILKYLNSSIKGSAARAKDWAAPAEASSEAKAPAKRATASTKRADAKPAPAKAPRGAEEKPAFEKRGTGKSFRDGKPAREDRPEKRTPYSGRPTRNAAPTRETAPRAKRKPGPGTPHARSKPGNTPPAPGARKSGGAPRGRNTPRSGAPRSHKPSKFNNDGE